MLRVSLRETDSYEVVYGRGKKETLGGADVLTRAQARELEQQVLGDVEQGKDRQEERRKSKEGSVREFLDREYERRRETEKGKTGEGKVERVKQVF